MAKKKLIVVHGMGQHDEASVKKEVVATFAAAFELYESLRDRAVEDEIEIVPLVYNRFFDDYRKKVAAQSGPIAERLGAIDGSLPLTLKVVKSLNSIESDLGKDEFFTTHWLDVILYRFTLLAEPIRLEVAKGIAEAVAAVGSANVHVLGHSLGTAVLHDTLAKSYGPENLPQADGTALNLSPVSHRLAGVHMVANVSRALQTFVKVGASIVRPGPLGCTSVFAEYRHKLDPITKIKPFDPTDNDGWVPHDIFGSVYRLLEPSSVTAANVHGLGHYLAIPAIHQQLFKLLFGFRPKKQEREDGEKAYFEATVDAKAQALQAAFDDIELADEESAQALLKAAKALKNMVQGFGEKFQ